MELPGDAGEKVAVAVILTANTGVVLSATASGEIPSRSGRKVAVIHISVVPPAFSDTALGGASNARSMNAESIGLKK